MKVLEGALRLAVLEAEPWVGATTPNPAVGAAAVDAGGRILGVAAHRRAGEAHAEASLLGRLREQGLLERVDTLVVTLEPCAHQGKTPPCVDAILEASGLRRVAFARRDPNPVASGGASKLESAGKSVVDLERVLGHSPWVERAASLIEGFECRMRTGLPWLTVKIARDEQGSMLPPQGTKTFTSEASLRLAHELRRRADAVLTGSGTVLADSPLFTVRHLPDFPGKRRVLVVLDRRRRVSEEWISAAGERGFDVRIRDELGETLKELGREGINEVLVEAGPTLTEAVLSSRFGRRVIEIRRGPSGEDTVRSIKES